MWAPHPRFHGVADTSIKSILDYQINFNALKDSDTHYMALGMNYSVTGIF
jgi:hypothetical protein